MDIYSPMGTKVRFAPGNNGYESENAAARQVLELNAIYTIDHTDVGSWSTDVTLQEFPSKRFNSVLFESVNESSL
ncbi:hypothetical protein D3C87_2115180 [compost metagenome]